MMIYKDEKTDPSGTGPVSNIMREMAGLCDPTDEDRLHEVREVAAGVQSFLDEEHCAGRAPSHVRALAARALIYSGRKDMASRLLLIGGGLVKTSESALVNTGTVLILDLKPLVIQDDECLDMVFRRCVLLLVDSMAHMWDDDGGCGMLGLRNVRTAAGAVLGTEARPGPVHILAREIKSLCEVRLDACQRGRNWKERPMVLDLDWMAASEKKRRKGST